MDHSQFAYINDLGRLEVRSDFTTIAVLTRCDPATSTAGGEFLKLEFSDRTGRFHAVLFSNHRQFDELRRARTGTVWIASGKIEYYQQGLSPKLISFDAVPETNLNGFMERLQRVSPVPIHTLLAELERLITSIAKPKIRAAVEEVLETIGPSFSTSPAAQAMHHAYRHGLLTHTVSLCQLAEAIIPLYPRLELDRDVIIAALLIHDAGKVFEYSQGLATDVTQEMFLCGHITKVYNLWTAAAAKHGIEANLAKRVAHAVLAHHGEQQYGSPVEPHTAEAWLVHLVDLMDARFAGIEELFASDPGNIVGRKSALGAVLRASSIC